MTEKTQKIGEIGERLATKFLEQKGFVIIDRNYRTRFGEIDIIAKDKKELIFVEVKAKNTSRFGKPYEMVTKRKKRKLRMTAKSYLQDSRIDSGNTPWRIDVISIDYETGKIEWLKNAVQDE